MLALEHRLLSIRIYFSPKGYPLLTISPTKSEHLDNQSYETKRAVFEERVLTNCSSKIARYEHLLSRSQADEVVPAREASDLCYELSAASNIIQVVTLTNEIFNSAARQPRFHSQIEN